MIRRLVCENEVEERRVIRLLAELAADVPALPDDRLYSFSATSASAKSRRRRLHAPARYLPAVAAAVLLAIGVSVQVQGSASRPPSSASQPGSAELVTFTEGTALELLVAAETR
jgi:ferric-dicitrate binding protein FerR (iron transport regulator)